MFNDDMFVYGNQNVQIPAHINFGKFMLDRTRPHGDKIALEHGVTGSTVTYKALIQYAVNMSVALTKLGVRRGDVVGVGSESRSELVGTSLGVILTGATYTPYALKSGQAILKHMLNLTKPSYIICSSQFWNKYNDIVKELDGIKNIITLDDNVESVTSISTLIASDVDVNKFEPTEVRGQSDTACILYSSGTTGLSKGVQLTHLNCILNSLPDQFMDESLQTALIMGEWYHNYDCFMTYKFLAMGRKVIYLSTNKNSEVVLTNILKCVSNLKINITFFIPFIIIKLLKQKDLESFNLDSLKIIYSRGAFLHSKAIEQVQKLYSNIRFVCQGYGMTEAGELTTEMLGPKGPKSGSVGVASPGITIKVVDPVTRVTLGPNQNGEICIRGPVLMKGYIGIERSTLLDEQGFLNTGDLGYYDDDNYFFIVGRLKDLISYGGYDMSPLELETILQLHPGVSEAGVVAKPDPDYDEIPAAFVVKQPGVEVTEKELEDYVSLQVPPYMYLRGGVKFIDEIPKNTRGKILRRKLQEMF